MEDNGVICMTDHKFRMEDWIMKDVQYYQTQLKEYVFKSFDHVDAYVLGEHIARKMIKETERAIVYIEMNKQ